jgi:uncharacterized membrane protein
LRETRQPTESRKEEAQKRSPVSGAKKENLQLEILAVLTALLTAALLPTLAGLLVRLLTLLIVLLLAATALLLATLAALLILLIALIGHQITPWVLQRITLRFGQTFLVQHTSRRRGPINRGHAASVLGPLPLGGVARKTYYVI